MDATLRRQLEQTRLGRRVLCTDQHNWSTGRIVYAFRGQWNVEELFRRAKKGGVVPWGPSHQWADGSLRLHTFATVLGLMLVSLAKLALGTDASARETMKNLAAIRATLVRTTTGGPGRRPTVMLAAELTTEQRRAVWIFQLERWFPDLLSCMTSSPARPCSTHIMQICDSLRCEGWARGEGGRRQTQKLRAVWAGSLLRSEPRRDHPAKPARTA